MLFPLPAGEGQGEGEQAEFQIVAKFFGGAGSYLRPPLRLGGESERFRTKLRGWYPVDQAMAVKHAEAFELCEYGAQPDKAQLKKLFPFFD